MAADFRPVRAQFIAVQPPAKQKDEGAFVMIEGRPVHVSHLPLHYFAKEGDIARLFALVRRPVHPQNVDGLDKEGHTPLFYALLHERDQAAEALIGLGAHLNPADKRDLPASAAQKAEQLFARLAGDAAAAAGELAAALDPREPAL